VRRIIKARFFAPTVEQNSRNSAEPLRINQKYDDHVLIDTQVRKKMQQKNSFARYPFLIVIGGLILYLSSLYPVDKFYHTPISNRDDF
jgi:hypothetical protein